MCIISGQLAEKLVALFAVSYPVAASNQLFAKSLPIKPSAFSPANAGKMTEISTLLLLQEGAGAGLNPSEEN